MSEDQSIAVICVGATLSPFVKGLVTREVVSVSYITNNACDFQIHHADPSKQLTYHLEFTNIIEQKAKRSIDSLAVFETLGKFFEFYNPLHLSTLNYLISKYATNVNPTNKNLTSLWKEITKTIFDEENILPVFDTNRVLHVKEGEVEIPVRQCVLSKEIRENGEEGEKSGKKKEKEK
ncbi:hypothetical protein GF325_05385, partial [Candidatus Bathyarchaeota archaeon]|nr:hypothetical protein [Candidatus Bathyarchaeota archaeon]